MSEQSLPGRIDDIELARTAAMSEDVLINYAKTSERQAATLRERGHTRAGEHHAATARQHREMANMIGNKILKDGLVGEVTS